MFMFIINIMIVIIIVISVITAIIVIAIITVIIVKYILVNSQSIITHLYFIIHNLFYFILFTTNQ
jgi:hypothetical protein